MTEPAMVDLTVTYRFSASAERVYDAWLDEATLGRWFFNAPTGTVVRADIDARVGGTFLIVDRRDGTDIPHYGTYRELERPRRLVFDFSVMSPTENRTRVQIDIVPCERGCELTLVHERIPAEHADKAQGGWSRMLDGLARTIV